MRILVVEDEIGTALLLERTLKKAGYQVDIAENGEQAAEYISIINYDIITLDLVLPKLSGLELLRQLRQSKNLTPVLLISAQDTVEDRVKGLDEGADDYLVKPFQISELLARLRVLQRRLPLQYERILQVGDLTMDLAERKVTRAGQLLSLTNLEFNLLAYLMENSNQVVSRKQIGKAVWNLTSDSDFKVVEVYIGYLRRKIDQDFAYPLIHTVRGVGYCLKTSSD